MTKYTIGKYDINGKLVQRFEFPKEWGKIKGLKDIDEITTQYSDETDLKCELRDLHLLDNIDCFIEIISEDAGKKGKLPFVYQDKSEYLMLKNINDHLTELRYDKEFLTKLINYYDRENIKKVKNQNININAIAYYTNIIDRLDEEQQRDFEQKYKDFIYRLEYSNGKEYYKQYRELGLFICRFLKQRELEKLKEEIITENIIRYKNIADADGYPGDLEKWNTDGYLDDKEEYYR